MLRLVSAASEIDETYLASRRPKKTIDGAIPALADARFAKHIDAETQTAPEVAEDILRQIAA